MTHELPTISQIIEREVARVKQQLAEHHDTVVQRNAAELRVYGLFSHLGSFAYLDRPDMDEGIAAIGKRSLAGTLFEFLPERVTRIDYGMGTVDKPVHGQASGDAPICWSLNDIDTFGRQLAEAAGMNWESPLGT